MELLWTAGEVPKARLAGGSQSPVRPKDITKLWPGGSTMTLRSSVVMIRHRETP